MAVNDAETETFGTNVVVVDFKAGALNDDPRPEEVSMQPVSGPVVEFARAGQCRHVNVAVHEDLAEVVCRDCDAKLNPIWVLTRMAKEETKWSLRRLEFQAAKEDLAQRQRCKCQHCGKMTNIRI